MSMVTRASVDRYRAAASRVAEDAVRDLDSILAIVADLPADQARDELLALLPELADYHGGVLAAAAAEWYEEIRDAPGSYTATVAAHQSRDAVEGTTRYAAGFLFDGQRASTREVLAGAMQRWVQYAGRETIARNVQLDPAKPRFARVPSGGKTCPWCEMLASRGWVYMSKETAGINGHYHDNCNCQVVPSWESGETHLDGYDPDAMFARYEAARRAWEQDNPGRAPSLSDLADVLRAQHPDLYTPRH